MDVNKIGDNVPISTGAELLGSARSSNNVGSAEEAARLIRSLDTSAMTKKHVGLYTISSLGHLFDGYDVQMLGVVLPGIAASFALSPNAVGALASSAAFGMFFGAIGIGMMTDRFGRKTSLMLALGTFSLFSLLSALAPNYQLLFGFRVLAGIGLGAEVVTMYAYIAEFLPTRTRGTLLTTSSFFWQMSAVGAALLGIAVIPHFGWRWMFVIGTVPAIIVTLIWRFLPESVRFLLLKDRMTEADKVVRNISSVDPNNVVFDDEARAAFKSVSSIEKRSSAKELLTGRFRRLTIGLWIIQFFNGFVLFSIIIWLPSILLKQGFTFVHSLEYVAVIVTAGAVGNIGAGLLLLHFGRRPTMFGFFIAGGVLLMAWSQQHTTLGILFFGAAASFFIYGVSGIVYTYTSEIYPTRHRGTGTGWSGGAQRVGAIVAPIIVGHMLGAKLPVSSVYIVLAIGFAIAALAVITSTHETGHDKTLEEIDVEISV